MATALQEMLYRLAWNKAGDPVGILSICSSHPEVILAGFRTMNRYNGPLLIESTSNQVNQFGGYSGMTPEDFTAFVKKMSKDNRFDTYRIIFGGDHLGTNPWQELPADEAMSNTRKLVLQFIRAGYRKIHLDLSFPCADDQRPLKESAIIKRTVELVRLCETNRGSIPLFYVIGTEVPAPGGSHDKHQLIPTNPEDVHRIIDHFVGAFGKAGLETAWKRVIALVVQPGVEFGNNFIHHYAPDHQLSHAIDQYDHLVYEVHSTDYQRPDNLMRLVARHFFFLKVGPWLTFTLREALFLLEMIEKEMGVENPSEFRQTLIEAMMANPEHWEKYYQKDESLPSNLAFSYLDRARYYLNHHTVKAAQSKLYRNLSAGIPKALLGKYMPAQYQKVKQGKLNNNPQDLAVDRVCDILDKYMIACGYDGVSD